MNEKYLASISITKNQDERKEMIRQVAKERIRKLIYLGEPMFGITPIEDQEIPALKQQEETIERVRAIQNPELYIENER